MISKWNSLSSRKMRGVYIIAVFTTILLGLASRKFSYQLIPFIAENAGDFLWAMMVYFGFRFLFVHGSLFIAILLSFLFSFGIEFSQLYQADWMNQIRGTLLGALILGKGFLTVDLIRYTAGILIAAVFDKMIFKLTFRNE
jgi:glycopeptide antibiotics resistance protein